MTLRCGSLALPAAALLAALSQSAGAEPQARLSLEDIARLDKAGAGAGTSGAPGIQTIMLSGNPRSDGPYTIALRVPPHAVIAAHTHRDDRTAVVISGIWWFGYGKSNQVRGLKPLGPGSFYTEPAKEPHFARTGDKPAVVYITGYGPTDTQYINAAADPRRPGQDETSVKR